MECSPAERDLEGLVDGKLSVRQMYPDGQGEQWYPEVH